MSFFLANLGISDIDQARGPTVATFPQVFNINGRPQWESAVLNLPDGTPTDLWTLAIEDYVTNCVDSGIYPFSNFKQSANDQIMAALVDARRAVVKFLNQSQMLKHVTLKVSSREVQMNNLGFTIRILGAAVPKDPTFEKWLLQMPMPSFRLKKDGVYHKTVAQNVTMVVFNEGVQRWRVGYEIVVLMFPSLPGRHLPSEAELKQFIMRIMWMPILKSHRPEGYHHRLI